MNDASEKTDLRSSFLTGLLIGEAFFLVIYGGRILNPAYEDWLLTNWYDLSQHHVGWKLYRQSSLIFPPGLCDNSFYPYYSSVVYTDSMPLLCFIFKLFSPILPETFQFFGIYGMICFMLQGGFAKLLLCRVLKNEWLRNIACIPFIISAPLLHRMFYHTALASQYLILAAMLIFIYRDRINSDKKLILCWCLLGVFCIGIHFVIYSIVSVIFSGFVLRELLEKRPVLIRIRLFFLYMFFYLGSTVLTFYLFGGFYVNIFPDSEGLGEYIANINSLFNPLDYSKLIPGLGQGPMQYEGFSYIGIAAIILIFPALLFFFMDLPSLFKEHKNDIISISLTLAVLFIISLSPKIMFGEKVIVELKLPEFIIKIWSIFRASGRFLWPVSYTLILIIIYYASKQKKSAFASLLIIGCLLQIYEYSGRLIEYRDRYLKESKASFSADKLDSYDLSDKKHIQFMHPYYFGEFYGDDIRDELIGYTQYALRHDMTVSNFHFSREDTDSLNKQIEISLKELSQGRPREDTIYVFRREDIDENSLKITCFNVNYIYLDDTVLLVSS